MISLVVVLVIAALAWGVAALLLGRDPGLQPAEPDGRATPLPAARPLTEADLGGLRFDTAPRGYRMAQVDAALRRAAYDVGYKEELIGVLEAEVTALREGRLDEAEALRQAREAASRPPVELLTEPSGEPPSDEPRSDEPVALGDFALGATPEVGEGPQVGQAPEAAEPAAGPAVPAAEPARAGPAGAEPAQAEPAVAAEPDDSVDTDLEPAAAPARSEGPTEVRPADGDT